MSRNLFNIYINHIPRKWYEMVKTERKNERTIVRSRPADNSKFRRLLAKIASLIKRFVSRLQHENIHDRTNFMTFQGNCPAITHKPILGFRFQLVRISQKL